MSVKFMWKIFFVALVFSLTVGVLSNRYLTLILAIRNLSPYTVGLITFWLGAVSFFVSPALFFGVLYLIGRNLDFVAEFMPVAVSLFLGCWLGHLVGFFPIDLIYFTSLDGTLTTSTLLYYLWHIFAFAFSAEFFIGFAAVSMAHIKKS